MISLVVPSRGRPGRFREMLASAKATARGTIECVAYLDLDDPTIVDYPVLGTHHKIIGPRCVLSEAWNRAAILATGDLLMMAGDDLIFRTSGWDLMVKAAAERYNDGIVLVHVNDGYQNENLATHPIVTRRWVQVVDMLCPPYFTADYNDVWLHEVADQIGRRVYVPEVLIEHIHPDAGKAMFDVTYAEQRERRVKDDMPGLYEQLAPERAHWAANLRRAMWYTI